MWVKLELFICCQSGQPMIYTSTIIEPSDYIVPQEYCRFVRLIGWHFWEYIPEELRDDNTCFPQALLSEFPEWSSVLSSMKEHSSWTEADHNTFKMALEYFASMGGFMIHWR